MNHPADSDPVPQAITVGELRKGRHLRYRVTVMLGAVIVLVVGAFAYYRYEQDHACDVAYEVRKHNEALDRDVFTRLGRRFDIEPAEVDAFLADIGQAYDAMPTPAAC